MITTYIRIFLLGLWECRGDFGLTFDDDPESPKSRAYDRGRNLGRMFLLLDKE
jgi:hypothetical protein